MHYVIDRQKLYAEHSRDDITVNFSWSTEEDMPEDPEIKDYLDSLWDIAYTDGVCQSITIIKKFAVKNTKITLFTQSNDAWDEWCIVLPFISVYAPLGKLRPLTVEKIPFDRRVGFGGKTAYILKWGKVSEKKSSRRAS